MKFAFITLASILGVTALSAQTSWTPYQAQYVQYTDTVDSTGHTNRQQITGREERSADGSLLTTVEHDGTPVHGKLWDAKTGRITGWDYVTKRGMLIQIADRKHTTAAHSDAPLSTQVIAGITCVGYPNHSSADANGPPNGAVWVDEADDLIMKTEIHDRQAGHEVTFTRTITKISFAAPDPDSMKVPADIMVSSRN